MTNETTPTPSSHGPTGIGGWLVLPAIGLVLSPCLTLGGIFEVVNVLQSGELDSVGSRATGLESTLLALSAVDVGFLIFQIYVAVEFFMKRPFVPALIILYLSLNVVLTAISVGWTMSIIGWHADFGTELARALLTAAIWIPYFVFSKRVHNTFARGRSAAPVPAAPNFEHIRSYADWLDLDIIQRERLQDTLTPEQRDRLRQMESQHYGLDRR